MQGQIIICPYRVAYFDNAVNMVRHYHETIKIDLRKMLRYLAPAFFRHDSGIIERHIPVFDCSE